MGIALPARPGTVPAVTPTGAERSYDYLLPLVGVGAAAAGVILLWDPLALGSRLIPLALLALGSAAVVGAVAAVRWPAPRQDVPPPHRGLVPRPTATPPGPRRAPSSPRRHRWLTPESGIGRATTSRHSWSGEEIWQRWRQSASARFGTAVIPPVAATAYIAPRENVAPFASRDRAAWLLPRLPLPPETRPRDPARPARAVGQPSAPASRSTRSASLAGARSPSARPFSLDELDRLFPQEADTSIRDRVIDALDDLPTARPVALETEPRAPSPGESPPADVRHADPDPSESHRVPTPVLTVPSGDLFTPRLGLELLPPAAAVDELLYLEAINPVPPHLRGGTLGPSAPDPALPRPFAGSPPPRACHSCNRGLGDFRTWSPCARCGRPICRRCLGRSFRLGEDGVCWDCSDPTPLPAS